jgi:hypothetical protein
MTIKIHGLTAHQHTILDRLWSMNTLDEVEEWMSTLPESDQQLASSLSHLLLLEQLDIILLEQIKDYSEARSVLERIASKL